MIALAYVMAVWVAVTLGLTAVWVVVRGVAMMLWWMRDKGMRR